LRFASLSLLERDYSGADLTIIRKPLDFPERHKFDISGLKSTLAKMSGMRVLVIGDLIIDEYVTCDAVGMSQEDPTLVVTPIVSKTFVGGAGGVAAHARGLGADVRYWLDAIDLAVQHVRNMRHGATQYFGGALHIQDLSRFLAQVFGAVNGCDPLHCLTPLPPDSLF
jgi:hypothetical protein